MTADDVEAATAELVKVVGAHCHFDPNLPADIRAAYIHLAETAAAVAS